VFAVALMMLGALGVRALELDQPIVTFHPTRHYRSAVIARACYYDRAAGVPAWAHAVADAARRMQPSGEIPLMEWAACATYLALGHENVMMPRVFAVVIWIAGAIPLWWLALRLASPAGGLIAVALYLFLPYGIVASRNFQPDPLMTLASLWALVGLVRHHDRPTTSRFLIAGALVGLAILIKPMSVFLTIPPIVALATLDSSAASWRRHFALAALGMLPGAIYYGYDTIFGTLAQDQMRMRFVPALLPTMFFWGGLARMIGRVVTWPLFVLALTGVAFAPSTLARRLTAAIFAGYALFAVAFTYHMATHDYYHLPYIPVVAIAIAMLFARIAAMKPGMAKPLASWPAVAAFCTAAIAYGAIEARPRLRVEDAAALEQLYQEIGEAAEHSSRVLFLDAAYGYALMYHAQIAGDSWPNMDDLNAERIDGEPAIDAETRYERDFADYRPSYFVITDLESLRGEPDLEAMLAWRAEPVSVAPRYRVYRLRTAALRP
jgi:hypothetical protein